MNQQTKAVTLIAIILVITVGVGIYFVKKNKTVPKNPKAQNQTQKTQTDPAQTKDEQKPENKVIKTISVAGTVSAISKDSLEIKNGEVVNTFAFTSETSVLAVTGAKIEKKTIADIKKGETVSVMLNQADSKVLSIQIGKDAGNAI